MTEAEGAAGVTEAQDMLFVYNILKSLGLKVQLPMVLEMDNKGAVDLANSWSVGGRTRHVDVRMYFLRELKDDHYDRVLVQYSDCIQNRTIAVGIQSWHNYCRNTVRNFLCRRNTVALCPGMRLWI